MNCSRHIVSNYMISFPKRSSTKSPHNRPLHVTQLRSDRNVYRTTYGDLSTAYRVKRCCFRLLSKISSCRAGTELFRLSQTHFRLPSSQRSGDLLWLGKSHEEVDTLKFMTFTSFFDHNAKAKTSCIFLVKVFLAFFSILQWLWEISAVF